ncbi:hypothetical protein V5N11_010402 [Cardamine amara subsp. amara]|uniref:Uncharacterized protein n=1 Tax=Cardamine amara subsp. amara TaxID=228776 RepID=A0ABD0ZIK4_CARAN
MARSMETSLTRRVVRKELQLANVENKETYNTNYKGASTSNSANWKMKSIVTDSHQGMTKQGGRMEQKPRRHNSSAELDEIKRKGICFKCDGQWSQEHKCPNKELRVLTVINNFDVEILEGNIEKELEEPVGQLMKLSLQLMKL